MDYRTVLKLSLAIALCTAVGCASDDDDTSGADAGGGTGGSGGTGEAGSDGSVDSGEDSGDDAGGMMAGDASDGMVGTDLGEGDGDDVITIGDSWMRLNATVGIELSLEAISGRDYRNYGIPGTIVLSDDANQIPGQYYGAIEEDADVKTVIMTAGGNDTLQGGCLPSDCAEKIDEVSARLKALMDEMAEDGVQDVFYIGYAVPPDSLGTASNEYARMKIPMQCNADTKPRCHHIDTQDMVSELISSDGIHPTEEGYDVAAQMVWDAMQEAGVRR